MMDETKNPTIQLERGFVDREKLRRYDGTA